MIFFLIQSHPEFGSYLVGANRLLDELDVVLLFVDFKYSSSLSRTTSGLSLALYVRQRFMNVLASGVINGLAGNVTSLAFRMI